MVRKVTLAMVSLLACSCGTPTSLAATTVSSVVIEVVNTTTGNYLYESAIYYWAGPPASPPQIQLHAIAKYEDGHQLDVTSLTTWQSSNAFVATVSAAGGVTIVALGQANFTATFHGVVGGTSVTTTSNPSDLD